MQALILQRLTNGILAAQIKALLAGQLHAGVESLLDHGCLQGLLLGHEPQDQLLGFVQAVVLPFAGRVANHRLLRRFTAVLLVAATVLYSWSLALSCIAKTYD